MGGQDDDSSRWRYSQRRASFRRTSEGIIIRLFTLSSSLHHVRATLFRSPTTVFTSDSFSNDVAGKIAVPPASGSCAKTLIRTSSHARRDRSRCIPQLKQSFTICFTLDTGWYIVRDVIDATHTRYTLRMRFKYFPRKIQRQGIGQLNNYHQ